MKNIFTSSRPSVFNDTDEQVNIDRIKKLSSKLPPQDIIGIVVAFALLPIGFIFETTFILSFWHIFLSEEWLLSVIPMFLIGVNFYLNIYKMIKVGPNGPSGLNALPVVMKAGFKYCHYCNFNSPPRSHHCPVCNTCILRRDHHCSFTGVCVGHFNQRFFIAACLNASVISLVCCIWNWYHLWIALPKLTLSQYWNVMLPHLALIFGFVSLYQFFAILVFIISTTVFGFICYLILAQLFCLWNGHTRVEFLLGIRAYDIGFFENVKQVMGERWPLLLISPLFAPFSPLPSDGISFPTRESASVRKSTKTY